MPKSRVRRKVRERRAYVAPIEAAASSAPKESPKWVAAAMVASFLIGLAWIVTFYISTAGSGKIYPIPSIHTWNILVGFGFVALGFGFATRWR